MPIVFARPLRSVAKSILSAAGTPDDIAECFSQSLVSSNLKGVDSHGVMRLEWSSPDQPRQVIPRRQLYPYALAVDTVEGTTKSTLCDPSCGTLLFIVPDNSIGSTLAVHLTKVLDNQRMDEFLLDDIVVDLIVVSSPIP